MYTHYTQTVSHMNEDTSTAHQEAVGPGGGQTRKDKRWRRKFVLYDAGGAPRPEPGRAARGRLAVHDTNRILYRVVLRMIMISYFILLHISYRRIPIHPIHFTYTLFLCHITHLLTRVSGINGYHV
jgi:hypothetical protein